MNPYQPFSGQVDRTDLTAIDNLMVPVKLDAPKVKNLRAEQCIVGYDRKRQRAEQLGKGFFGGFLRNSALEYYFVDTYDALEATQQGRVLSMQHKPLPLRFTYKIRIMKGWEEKAVETLARRNTPVKLLDDLLYQWAHGALNRQAEMVFKDLHGYLAQVAEAIKAEAAGVGLDVTVRIGYQLPSGGNEMQSKKAVTVACEKVLVQPKEYNEFIVLGFEVVLIPEILTGGYPAAALAFKDSNELQELLMIWMQEFIRKQTTYKDMVEGLQGGVRDGLLEYWSEQLHLFKKCWKPADLRLNSMVGQPVDFRKDDLKIKVVLRNTEIELNYKILLYREDAQLFANARIKDLGQWVKDKLHMTAQRHLGNIFYALYISRSRDYNEQIKQLLSRDTMQIGYRVDLLSVDALDPKKLQIDLRLNDEEQVFQTRLNDKVRLKAHVSGTILSLDHPTYDSILVPETIGSLNAEIKTDVLREIRNAIMSVEPDNFYTKFDEEVPKQIRMLLVDLLTERYNLDAGKLNVFVSIEHSELTERLAQLSLGSLYAPVSLFNGRLRLKVKFSVIGVEKDRWAFFARSKYNSIEDEKTSIQEDVRLFYQAILSHKLVKPGMLYADIARYARQGGEECAKEIADKRCVTIKIESIEEHNEVKELAYNGGVDLIMSERQQLLDLAGRLQQGIIKAKEAQLYDLAEELQKELAEHKKQMELREASYVDNKLLLYDGTNAGAVKEEGRPGGAGGAEEAE